jgi:hypothetical protein
VARGVASLALVVALESGLRALYESGETIWFARGEWDEPLAEAQDRLCGAAYMESVRRVRRLFPPERTVHFVDAQSAAAGADYVALYFLAPRRLIRLGHATDPWSELRARLAADAEWIVRVPEVGLPLEVEPAATLRPRRHRARQDRP